MGAIMDILLAEGHILEAEIPGHKANRLALNRRGSETLGLLS
jgi:hypothetical protein